jgi:hypothetical protein
MKNENIIKGQFLSQFDYECEFHNYIEVHSEFEPINSTNEMCDSNFKNILL